MLKKIIFKKTRTKNNLDLKVHIIILNAKIHGNKGNNLQQTKIQDHRFLNKKIKSLKNKNNQQFDNKIKKI